MPVVRQIMGIRQAFQTDKFTNLMKEILLHQDGERSGESHRMDSKLGKLRDLMGWNFFGYPINLSRMKIRDGMVVEFRKRLIYFPAFIVLAKCQNFYYDLCLPLARKRYASH